LEDNNPIFATIRDS